MIEKGNNDSELYLDVSNKKFIRLIQCLNLEAIKEFKLYIKAPHLGLKKEEVYFFNFLAKHYPSFTDIPITFLKDFFSNNQQTFNKTLSRLTRILEKWLIYQEMDKHPLLMKQLLVDAYADKMTPSIFQKFGNNQQKMLNSNHLEHPDFLYAQFKINSTVFHYSSTNRYQLNHSIKDLSQQLDDYFIAEKLQLICQQISRSQLVNESDSLSLDKEILRIAEQKLGNQYIQRYLNLIRLFQQFDENLMLDVFQQFKNDLKIFNRIEAAIYLQLLINYVIRLNNTSQSQYLKFQFELYQFALDKDLIVFNHQLADDIFYNIVSAGCHLNNYDFATEFIEEYKQFLQEGDDSPLVSLTKGIIAFHQRDFSQSYDLVKDLNIKKLNFKITSRGVELRCIFKLFQSDQSYFTLLDSSISNFNQFVRTCKDISQVKRIPFKNMTKVIQKLKKAILEPSVTKKRTSLNKLEEFLKDEKNKVYSKKWLLDIIQDLRNN